MYRKKGETVGRMHPQQACQGDGQAAVEVRKKKGFLGASRAGGEVTVNKEKKKNCCYLHSRQPGEKAKKGWLDVGEKIKRRKTPWHSRSRKGGKKSGERGVVGASGVIERDGSEKTISNGLQGKLRISERRGGPRKGAGAGFKRLEPSPHSQECGGGGMGPTSSMMRGGKDGISARIT